MNSIIFVLVVAFASHFISQSQPELHGPCIQPMSCDGLVERLRAQETK